MVLCFVSAWFSRCIERDFLLHGLGGPSGSLLIAYRSGLAALRVPVKIVLLRCERLFCYFTGERV